MGCPTVNSCCCCINLRVAGYIFGILSLIIAFSTLTGDCKSHISSFVISLLLSVSWLFGIYKNKPCFLLPTIVIGFIILIFVYFTPPLAVAAFSLLPKIKELEKFREAIKENIFIIMGIYALVVIITTYLWIVEYSIYRYIKEASKGHYRQARSKA